MIYPVIFKDKCSCGGELCYKTINDTYLDEYDDSIEVLCIRCRSCGKSYSVRWVDRSPYPILNPDNEMSEFLNMFKA
jgi:hypothetical protein